MPSRRSVHDPSSRWVRVTTDHLDAMRLVINGIIAHWITRFGFVLAASIISNSCVAHPICHLRQCFEARFLRQRKRPLAASGGHRVIEILQNLIK